MGIPNCSSFDPVGICVNDFSVGQRQPFAEGRALRETTGDKSVVKSDKSSFFEMTMHVAFGSGQKICPDINP
jgi:hypothetical protein